MLLQLDTTTNNVACLNAASHSVLCSTDGSGDFGEKGKIFVVAILLEHTNEYGKHERMPSMCISFRCSSFFSISTVLPSLITYLSLVQSGET